MSLSQLKVSAQNENDNLILGLNLHSERSGISDIDTAISDTDDVTERLHLRQATSLNTKLQRIRDMNTPNLRKHKRKVGDNKTLSDWWKWYWSNPVEHIPFLHFLIMLILCPTLSIFWWMDSDSCFIITGGIAMFMCIYALNKFRILIGLKKQVNKYRELNLLFKKDNIKLQKEIERCSKAHKELKKTKKRITRANAKNKANLRAFEQIQVDMKIAGTKQVQGMTEIHRKAVDMKQSWRDELLSNERALLTSAYERFESVGDRTDGVTYEEFKELYRFLPKRYSKRFARMGTFTTFAQGGTVIDFEKFTKAIDIYATMEVDNVDLDPTPYATPLMTPYQSHGHLPMYSEQFGSLDLRNFNPIDLGLNPSSIASNQSDKNQSDVDNNNNIHYVAYSSYPGNNNNNTPLFSPSINSSNEMKSLLPPTQQQSFHLSDKYKSKSDTSI